jgi:hypothetical protein
LNDRKQYSSFIDFWSYTCVFPYFARYFSIRQKIGGNGLEIGALHQSLRVFNGAQVHVDRTTVDDLHSGYPELKDCSLASSHLKDYFSVVKTLLSQLVYKERGASKHRKIGN